MSKKKSKKDKIIYIDDGRTIADMSDLSGGVKFKKQTTSSRAKDIWKTYWSAVRMMFKPMLVVIGFILVAFIIVSLIFWAM